MLKETLKADLTAEMHDKARGNGNEVRLGVLRSVIAAVQKAETSGKTRAELDDAGVIAVLRSAARSRRDAAEEYVKVGATDRAALELSEAAVIDDYLPALATEEETREILISMIGENGFETKRDFGKAMALVKADPRLDARTASLILKDLLV